MATRPRTRSSILPSEPPAPPTLCFGATILLSAFLLFLVQPLLGRYILPWFGGGTGVWSACLLFFQAALIVGYAYAFALRRLPGRAQAVIHLVVLAATVALLPIAPSPQWKPAPGDEPLLRIVLLLLSAVGAPYVALATTGPLLQSWFTRLAPGRSPWRLYALSNLGSFLALPVYPLLIEPALTRSQQCWSWSAAFVVFALGAAWCAVALLRSPPAESGWAAGPRAGAPASVPARLGELALWLLLAACGSTMLVASTAVISDEVVPAPFVWVIPIAAYLLSFVVAFEWPGAYRRAVLVPALVIVAALVLGAPLPRYGWLSVTQVVLLHAVGVFLVCLVCHGELYRLRPAPDRLTTFYLLVAIGGAAGAAFVTVLAPRVFLGLTEYPVAVLGSLGLVALCMFRDPSSTLYRGARRPLWLLLLAASAAVAFIQFHASAADREGVIAQTRSFYGVIRVLEFDREGPHHRREVYNGRISHGIQYQVPKNRRAATCYYVPSSGVGRAVLTMMQRRRPVRVGIVGLGAGTLASYGRPNDVFRFYEINPDVTRVAKDSFSFLADCEAKVEVVDGDARLALEAEPPQRYDVLIVDAFSGDAIPFHLLTREAIALYRQHLAPDGVIALHVTNTYFELAPVARKLAADAGLGFGFVSTGVDERVKAWDAWWALLSADAKFFAEPGIAPALYKGQLPDVPEPWTDERVRLIDAIR